MTSPNGINWTPRTAATTNQWLSVCWSPELGLFVATAFGGNFVMTSPNGINWTSRSAAANRWWYTVCWSSEVGLFVAVSRTSESNHIMTSPNGINWTSRTAPNNNSLWSVCWSPELGIFVAVGDSGTGNRAMTSSLLGRPPTSYNVFDNDFNRIDQLGNWTFSQPITIGGGSVSVRSGSGNPEGVVTAVQGSLFLSSSGTIYVKASGSGNTGWVVK
jgi:hypothetical protein